MSRSGYIHSLREKVGNDLLELPSVTVVIRDASRKILFGRHTAGGRWLLPGGAVEPEETPSNAAVREAWEETGLHVRLERLIGVYGGPECTVEYDNGDRTSYLMVVFEASPLSGEPRPDGDEMLELGYFSADEANRLPLAKWVPELLLQLSNEASVAGFRKPTWSPPAT